LSLWEYSLSPTAKQRLKRSATTILPAEIAANGRVVKSRPPLTPPREGNRTYKFVLKYE
jgi:hypothetical protein